MSIGNDQLRRVADRMRHYSRKVVDEKGCFSGRNFEDAYLRSLDNFNDRVGPRNISPENSRLNSDYIDSSRFEALTDDDEEPEFGRPTTHYPVNPFSDPRYAPVKNEILPPIPAPTISTLAPLGPPQPSLEPAVLGPPDPPRLKVVLDLDNTLLHAYAKSKLSNAVVDLCDFRNPITQHPEVYRFSLSSSGQNKHEYYIKFRPGVREFLEALAECCDLAVHTNATKEYADVIISIIDPERKYFRQRLAARDDESCTDHRKDLGRLFGNYEIDGKDLLIVDDRRDVWDEQHHNNLIVCSHYEYFETRKEIFEKRYPSAGSTSSTVDSTNAPAEGPVPFDRFDSFEDYDSQLPYLQHLIVKVARQHHEKWQIDPNDADVRAILADVKQNILSSVVCVMSGMNRNASVGSGGTYGDNGPLYRKRLAALGASVLDEPTKDITHCVTARRNATFDRTQLLRGEACQFVHALWVAASEVRWERADEDDFYFKDLNDLFEGKFPTGKLQVIQWKAAALMRRRKRQVTKKRRREESPESDKEERSSLSSDPPSQGSTCLPTEGEVKRSRVSAWVGGEGWSNKYAADTRDPSASGTPPVEVSTRTWLATGMFSDGAEVWGPSEHVVLRYDPMKSSRVLYGMKAEGDILKKHMEAVAIFREQRRGELEAIRS